MARTVEAFVSGKILVVVEEEDGRCQAHVARGAKALGGVSGTFRGGPARARASAAEAALRALLEDHPREGARAETIGGKLVLRSGRPFYSGNAMIQVLRYGTGLYRGSVWVRSGAGYEHRGERRTPVLAGGSEREREERAARLMLTSARDDHEIGARPEGRADEWVLRDSPPRSR